MLIRLSENEQVLCACQVSLQWVFNAFDLRLAPAVYIYAGTLFISLYCMKLHAEYRKRMKKSRDKKEKGKHLNLQY